MKQSVFNIQGYLINLEQQVYLEKGTKYWKASPHNSTLNIEVGCLLKGEAIRDSIQALNKTYSSKQQCRNSFVDKITEKIKKGYLYLKGQIKSKKPIQREKVREQKAEKKKMNQNYSGNYYEKEQEFIKIEVLEHFVKIEKGINNQIKQNNIQSYNDSQQAQTVAQFTQSEFLKLGYKTNSSKFNYSLSQQEIQESLLKNTQINIIPPSQPSQKIQNNLLYPTQDIFQMTNRSKDRSRTVSPASSNKSADSFTSQKSQRLGKCSNGPSQVLLAKTWQQKIDPTNMYMSEKLDGVRCYWTGIHMYSRNGKRFYPPDFFVKNWPKSQLDGQLWVGRNMFHECLSYIKKHKPINQEWKKVIYLVFDAPGLNKPFKQRINIMQKEIININSPYISFHMHRICNGYADLFNQLQKVIKQKGEGIMLRHPDSYYQKTRSKSLLKVKTFYDDQAIVIGINPGNGRCNGMMGSLIVRNKNGIQFEVGSGFTDEQRKHPPKIGSKISYKYQQFNKDSGKPRFPIFLRVYQRI